MASDEFQRLEELFEEAVELPASERRAFLDRACGDDETLRTRLERLLRHADRPTLSVELHELRDPDDPATVALTPSERPGTRIGRYKLEQQLGEGGFGVVYMARQEEPVRRKVALKIIKLGMDTKQVIARFEAERQALAMMDHANIARVFDAGATETGRPYFVMELVKGIPITTYCDDHGLATRERLRLFVDVCHAVQHAHQKGIIHRDIKPSNVMVTVHDDAPVPKVIDFGIAKATNQRLTERTYFTEFRQLVGTPEYMSPEQAEMTGLDVDTRTDIYSLGVLLYELLTSTTPFASHRLSSASQPEIQRVICGEEPPRPSTRISALGDALSAVARSRGAEPGALERRIRGDLDWIVMKCLEKDRTRRYETASGLAMDVERHLREEPVLAGPPGARYRLGKFVRRHRAAVGTALLMAALLMVGVVGTTWGMFRANDAAAQATSINSFMSDVLTSAEPRRDGADVRLVDVLDDAADSVTDRFADHPELAAEVRVMLGRVYMRLDAPAKAEAQLRPAYETLLDRHGASDPRTVAAQAELAESLLNLRRFDDAQPLVEDLVARQRRIGAPGDRASLKSERLALLLAVNRGDYAEAEPQLRDLHHRAKQSLGPRDGLTLDILDVLVLAVSNSAWGASAEEQHDRFTIAREAAEELVAIKSEVYGADHPETLDGTVSLARLLGELGEVHEQEALARTVLDRAETLGEDHWIHLAAMISMANALNMQGRIEEAGDYAVRYAEAHRRKDGDRHVDTLAAMSNVLHILEAAERNELGQEYARLLHDRMRGIFGPEHAMTLTYRANLAHFLTRQGRIDEARSYFEAVRELLAHVPEGTSLQARYLIYEGAYLRTIGRYEEAETRLLRAVEIGPETSAWRVEPLGRTAHSELVALYEAWGKLEPARTWRERLAAWNVDAAE